ncbi:EscU/YscU/HrcU family type III secretion system export apparatus switch protein [Leeia sp.]|uniref:EscU/YscU/HrcU family type III secretion system export apparatus switch protein n=1 Tax=Leeia sp. TaxID=2884678 RepID=UPI0035AE0029
MTDDALIHPETGSLPDGKQLAVALSYLAGGRNTPQVVAKGRGLMAQAIIEKAKEAGVYVHESPELVSLLMQVDLDRDIPPDLYRAVAEVLAFVYMLEHGGMPDSLPELIPAAVPPAG